NPTRSSSLKVTYSELNFQGQTPLCEIRNSYLQYAGPEGLDFGVVRRHVQRQNQSFPRAGGLQDLVDPETRGGIARIERRVVLLLNTSEDFLPFLPGKLSSRFLFLAHANIGQRARR